MFLPLRRENFIRDQSTTVMKRWRLSEHKTKYTPCEANIIFILLWLPMILQYIHLPSIIKYSLTGWGRFAKVYGVKWCNKIQRNPLLAFHFCSCKQIVSCFTERISPGLQNLGTFCPSPHSPLCFACLKLRLTLWKLDNTLEENKPLEQMRVPQSHQHRLVFTTNPLWGRTAQLPDSGSWDDKM